MRESNQPKSPGVGDILECGGKRSATPLCSALLRGNRESLRKSAVAASLCRRSPKCWL